MADLRQRIDHPRKVMFLMSFLNGRPMVAGRSTAAEGIIGSPVGVNAVNKYEGYKLINDEAVIAAQPDAVLAMERASFRLDADTVFAHPAFATTPAAAHKIACLDGRALSARLRAALGAGGARHRGGALSGAERTSRCRRSGRLAGGRLPAMNEAAAPAVRGAGPPVVRVSIDSAQSRRDARPRGGTGGCRTRRRDHRGGRHSVAARRGGVRAH